MISPMRNHNFFNGPTISDYSQKGIFGYELNNMLDEFNSLHSYFYRLGDLIQI